MAKTSNKAQKLGEFVEVEERLQSLIDLNLPVAAERHGLDVGDTSHNSNSTTINITMAIYKRKYEEHGCSIHEEKGTWLHDLASQREPRCGQQLSEEQTNARRP